MAKYTPLTVEEINDLDSRQAARDEQERREAEGINLTTPEDMALAAKVGSFSKKGGKPTGKPARPVDADPAVAAAEKAEAAKKAADAKVAQANKDKVAAEKKAADEKKAAEKAKKEAEKAEAAKKAADAKLKTAKKPDKKKAPADEPEPEPKQEPAPKDKKKAPVEKVDPLKKPGKSWLWWAGMGILALVALLILIYVGDQVVRSLRASGSTSSSQGSPTLLAPDVQGPSPEAPEGILTGEALTRRLKTIKRREDCQDFWLIQQREAFEYAGAKRWQYNPETQQSECVVR